MRNKKLLRNLGLVAVALFAIGAVGYAANNGGSGSESEAGLDPSSIAATPASGFGFTFGGGPADGDLANTTKAASQAFDDAREEAAPAGEMTAASAGAPGAAPEPGGVGALASSVDRKIVSTASIQMQVDNVGASFEDVGRIAMSVGGFVASSSFSNQGERQLASVTIRVPSESYQSVLASLRQLGVKVDSESSDANDVTEEYTDLASRLRTLEATESQLLTLLGKAETISDILTVQDRLNYTRGEIEQVKGRTQLLDNLTSLATITVHLQPVVDPAVIDEPGDGVDLGAEVAEAWDNSIEFLGEVAAGVLTVVVFAWWVPLVGLPLLLGYKAVTRHHPQAVD